MRKGKKLSEETKEKIRIAHTGRIMSEETKAKMSKPKSPETKEKMRLASIAREAKKRESGYMISDETRAKLSARHKEQRTCIHCGYTSTKAVITRLHMDNCSKKQVDKNAK